MATRATSPEWLLGALMVLVLGGVAAGWLALRDAGSETVVEPVDGTDPASEVPAGPDFGADVALPPAPEPDSERLRARADAIAAIDPVVAIELYDQALALDPPRHDIRLQLGLVRWAVGRGDAAAAAWEEIPADAPQFARAKLWLALEALSRNVGPHQVPWPDVRQMFRAVPDGHGDVTTVARVMDNTIGDPDPVAAMQPLERIAGWEAALARIIISWNRPPGGTAAAPKRLVQDCTQVLEAGVLMWWVYGMRGVARHQLGDGAPARADLDRAVQLNPTSAQLRVARARMRERAGDQAGALVDLDTAVALQPNVPAALAMRARVLEAMGQTQRALADYTLATQHDPANVDAFVGRARVRIAVRDGRGAGADLERALALDPTRVDAYLLRARVRQQFFRGTGSMADYDAALRVDPKNPAVFAARARYRHAQGAHADALNDYEVALAFDPTLVDALYGRALVQSDMGRWAGAEADLERFLELAPGDSRAKKAWTMLAHARRKQER